MSDPLSPWGIHDVESRRSQVAQSKAAISRFQQLPLTASHTGRIGSPMHSARRPSRGSPRDVNRNAMQETPLVPSSIAAIASLYQNKRPMTSPVPGRSPQTSHPTIALFPQMPPSRTSTFRESSGSVTISRPSYTATTSPPAFSQRKDLEAAKDKSIKAGMGEWDLQHNPLHQERNGRILQGPLSPETLSNEHEMAIPDIYALYEALNTWSAGFCAAISAPIQYAKNREALLKLCFEAYAALWDESVIGAVFSSSQTLGKMRDMERLGREAAESQQDVAQLRAENEALHVRLNEFVKRQIEDSLLFEEMKERAMAAEADLSMMGKAEEQFSLSTTSAEVKLISLRAQVETAAAKNKEILGTLSDRDAAYGRLKTALSESQSLASKQYAQISELQRSLEESRRISANEIEASKEARAIAAQHPIIKAELERQLSDKSIALALLRSDLSVKSRDVDELRSENLRLNTEVEKHKDTFENAARRIEVAESLADSRLKEKESWKDKMASLEAENQRQGVRIRDLVKSYWPVMHRLKEAEAGHAAQLEVAKSLEEETKALREEAASLREVNAEAGLLKEMVKTLEAEGEVTLDEEALACMSMEAARARAFVRFSRRKIKDLSSKVISLLDVLAGAEKRQGEADSKVVNLLSRVKVLEAQLSSVPTVSDPSASSVEISNEGSSAKALERKMEEMESWITTVSLQCEALGDKLLSLMAKDPDHPRDQTDIPGASAPSAPLGRLAQALPSSSSSHAASTSSSSLIKLDQQWDKMTDCMDRFVDWAGVLFDSKSRMEGQLDVQETALAAKRASERADAIEKELAESRSTILAYEQTEVELKKQLAVNEELTRSVQSARDSLASTSNEVASLTGRLALLEDEHFDTRTKLLLALEQKDNLVAVRDRALAAAEESKKNEIAATIEKEEHRVMRHALELDLVGCKAWIRGIEEAELVHQKRKGELQNAKSEISKLKGGDQGIKHISSSADADITELLKSKTANSIRDKELAEERLRHKEAEFLILTAAVDKLRLDLSESDDRAAALQKEVWEVTLQMNQNDRDQRVALDSLISNKLQ